MIQRTKKGFSLVEVMLLFTVLAVFMAASIPVITKKSRAIPKRIQHGTYRCVYDPTANNGTGAVREFLYSNSRVIKNGEIKPDGVCSFNVPAAALYKLDLYSAGAGGTKYAKITANQDDNRYANYDMLNGLNSQRGTGDGPSDPLRAPTDDELAMFEGMNVIRSIYTGDGGDGGDAAVLYKTPYTADCKAYTDLLPVAKAKYEELGGKCKNANDAYVNKYGSYSDISAKIKQVEAALAALTSDAAIDAAKQKAMEECEANAATQAAPYKCIKSVIDNINAKALSPGSCQHHDGWNILENDKFYLACVKCRQYIPNNACENLERALRNNTGKHDNISNDTYPISDVARYEKANYNCCADGSTRIFCRGYQSAYRRCVSNSWGCVNPATEKQALANAIKQAESTYAAYTANDCSSIASAYDAQKATLNQQRANINAQKQALQRQLVDLTNQLASMQSQMRLMGCKGYSSADCGKSYSGIPDCKQGSFNYKSLTNVDYIRNIQDFATAADALEWINGSNLNEQARSVYKNDDYIFDSDRKNSSNSVTGYIEKQFNDFCNARFPNYHNKGFDANHKKAIENRGAKGGKGTWIQATIPIRYVPNSLNSRLRANYLKNLVTPGHPGALYVMTCSTVDGSGNGQGCLAGNYVKNGDTGISINADFENPTDRHSIAEKEPYEITGSPKFVRIGTSGTYVPGTEGTPATQGTSCKSNQYYSGGACVCSNKTQTYNPSTKNCQCCGGQTQYYINDQYAYSKGSSNCVDVNNDNDCNNVSVVYSCTKADQHLDSAKKECVCNNPKATKVNGECIVGGNPASETPKIDANYCQKVTGITGMKTFFNADGSFKTCACGIEGQVVLNYACTCASPNAIRNGKCKAPCKSNDYYSNYPGLPNFCVYKGDVAAICPNYASLGAYVKLIYNGAHVYCSGTAGTSDVINNNFIHRWYEYQKVSNPQQYFKGEEYNNLFIFKNTLNMLGELDFGSLGNSDKGILIADSNTCDKTKACAQSTIGVKPKIDHCPDGNVVNIDGCPNLWKCSSCDSGYSGTCCTKKTYFCWNEKHCRQTADGICDTPVGSSCSVRGKSGTWQRGNGELCTCVESSTSNRCGEHAYVDNTNGIGCACEPGWCTPKNKSHYDNSMCTQKTSSKLSQATDRYYCVETKDGDCIDDRDWVCKGGGTLKTTKDANGGWYNAECTCAGANQIYDYGYCKCVSNGGSSGTQGTEGYWTASEHNIQTLTSSGESARGYASFHIPDITSVGDPSSANEKIVTPITRLAQGGGKGFIRILYNLNSDLTVSPFKLVSSKDYSNQGINFTSNYAFTHTEGTPSVGSDVTIQNRTIQGRLGNVTIEKTSGQNDVEPRMKLESHLWTKQFEIGKAGSAGKHENIVLTNIGSRCQFRVPAGGKVRNLMKSTSVNEDIHSMEQALNVNIVCRDRENNIVYQKTLEGGKYNTTYYKPNKFWWYQNVPSQVTYQEDGNAAPRIRWKPTSLWAKAYNLFMGGRNNYDLNTYRVSHAGHGSILTDKCTAPKGTFNRYMVYVINNITESGHYRDTSIEDAKGEFNGIPCYPNGSKLLYDSDTLIQSGAYTLEAGDGGGGAVVITW